MSHSCLDNTTGKACRVLQPLRLKLALVTCLTLVAGLIADCGPGQLWGPGEAWGQVPSRPSAPELLPQETVAYVQIPNIQRLKENFAETGFGQMLADDRVAPLVEQVYEELSYLYTDYVEETVGVKLDELLTLPAGEICFAVVAPRRDTPKFVLLLDINEESAAADTLIRKGRELAERESIPMESETEGEFDVEIINRNSDEFLAYVRRDGTFLACTDRDVLSGILTRWMGEAPADDLTLADNRKFITIMNRCSSVHEGHTHEIAFFVDPFEIISSSLRGQAQRPLVLGILRTAGLDGLLGIGGTALFDEQGYESVTHLHISLANPRKGVFKIIALKPGLYEPEPWVPDDVVTYWTSNWDVNNVYQQIQEIYASYEPPTPWEDLVQRRINEQLEIDFEADVIDNLTGRMTYITWNQPPARFNSQMNILAIELQDGETFRNTVLAAIEDQVDLENNDDVELIKYEGIEIWQARVDEERAEQRRARMEEDGFTVNVRIPQPCMSIIGNSLIVAENPEFIHLAIDTFQGNHDKLLDDAQFQEVTDHMIRLLKTDLPSMTVYSRPDQQFRNLLQLTDDVSIREFLENASEEVEFAGRFKDALDDHPLPVEELVDYFSPSGAFLTNDESGLHMLAFQTRNEKVETSGSNK